MLLLVRQLPLALCAALLLTASATADTLQDALQHMQTGQTRHYRYREVRQLQLLDQDWVSTGEMIVAREQLAIAQQTPRSVLISITPSRMLYLDRESGTRRVRALNKKISMPGIQPLMQLFQSDSRSSLEQHFRIQFEGQSSRWLMTLIPKNGIPVSLRHMEISGAQQAGPDHIKLVFKDGDSTDWFLLLLATAETADQALTRLLQQSAE